MHHFKSTIFIGVNSLPSIINWQKYTPELNSVPSISISWYPAVLTNALSVSTEGGSIAVSLLGDVSSDSEINVIDVISLINFILYIDEPNDYQYWAADVNGDTALNILDVVMLVDMILER